MYIILILLLIAILLVGMGLMSDVKLKEVILWIEKKLTGRLLLKKAI